MQGKAELQTQGFISKLANTLIIEKSNPDKKGNFRPGPIDLKREAHTSFFSFLYKALLDGLKPSVGYDRKTENKVDSAIVKVTGLVNKFKAFETRRKEKRAERKKEREERKMKKDSIKNK